MGFNAVMTSAMAARGYLARRQKDRRISLLCHFDGNMEDTGPHGSVLQSNNTFYAPGLWGGQCITAVGNPRANRTAAYDCSFMDMSDDWTISWWLKCTNAYTSGRTIINIGGTEIFNITSGSSSAAGIGSTLVLPTATPVDGVWRHIVASRKDGTIRWYCNGTQKGSGSYTHDITGNKTVTIQLNLDSDSIDEFRFVSGVGTDAASVPIPSAPYTGFEPLGA